MYIEKPKQEIFEVEQTRQKLQYLLAQPTAVESPPCPNCTNHVVHDCNSGCKNAHTALSSHPAAFPIEPNITPLVFGLVSTRVVQTCWSCEGHMDSNNNLTSLPRVIFYTSSVVYTQLLHRHIARLKMDAKLQFSWMVVLTDFAQTWSQTYSVIPDLSFERGELHLGRMQSDLKVIAEDLQAKLKQLAREMIGELDMWLKNNQDNKST